MIDSRIKLKFYINEDYKRNLGNCPKWKYYVILLYGGDSAMVFRYLKALRKYEYAINVQKDSFCGKIIYLYRKFVWRKLCVKYNIVLPPNKIGYGFKIAHIVGGGIIINCKSIGNYCSANAGVIVGNNNGQDKIATIEDNVSLTIGSKVIGNVRIGANSVVAPNSVVVKDVPPNSIVSGIPAKVIKQNGIIVKS